MNPIQNKKKKAFVIMRFDSKYNNVFDKSIKPAFEEYGYECNRLKEDRKQVNVPNEIIRSIIYADIVLADISGNSPNVLYELGVSHSVGNKTITITSNVNEIPFDLKSYGVIDYTEEGRGLELLKIDIIETIKLIEDQKRQNDPQTIVRNLVQEAGSDYFDLRKKIEDKLEELNEEINKAKEFSTSVAEKFPQQDNSPVAQTIVGHVGHLRQVYPENVILISICGPGASGKSSFSKLLEEEIHNTFNIHASILATDSYMLSRADRIERDLLGFDPRANDLKQFYQDVKNLLENQAISIRPYDHKTGEHAEEMIQISPEKVIILEGIYSFFPELSNLRAKQLKYFIYADKHKAKELKFISDIKERGHSIYKALQHAVPEYSAYETYVLPHIKLADYIIRVSGYWKFQLPEKQDVFSLYQNL